jgi:hypothetical protein
LVAALPGGGSFRPQQSALQVFCQLSSGKLKTVIYKYYLDMT